MTQQDDLQRFITAQKRDYETALLEIKQGRKQTHWMWYIFPQMQGLGRSFTSQYYGIKNLKEAKDFLENPYLSNHLFFKKCWKNTFLENMIVGQKEFYRIIN